MNRILSVLFSSINWYKTRSIKWKIIITIALLLLIVFIFRKVFSNSTIEYEVTKPAYKSIIEYVTETGNVISTNVIPIYSTTNGVVRDLFVSNEVSVNENDPLFSVKSSASEQEKAAAWSNYLLAQTSLESAKATEFSLQASMFNDWDIYRNKYDAEEYKNVLDPDRNEPDFQVPQKEWLAAERNYINQQKIVSQKQADLQSKWLAYTATQDSTVVAPIDGIVENVSVSTGQSVVANSGINSIRPTLLLLTKIQTEIQVDINETNYPKIRVDQPVHITIDALEGQEFTGTVARKDTVGTNTQGVITYRIYIVISEENDNIFPGMTASIDIEVESKDSVLTVPSSAIKPYQGGKAVRVVGENGEIEYLPVTVGAKGDKIVEIISGIDESTEIITALKNDQLDRNGGGFFSR